MNWLDVFSKSEDDYAALTVAAGMLSPGQSQRLPLTNSAHLGARVDKELVDVSARTGYQLTKAKPQDAHARAAEYYQVCWP